MEVEVTARYDYGDGELEEVTDILNTATKKSIPWDTLTKERQESLLIAAQELEEEVRESHAWFLADVAYDVCVDAELQ